MQEIVELEDFATFGSCVCDSSFIISSKQLTKSMARAHEGYGFAEKKFVIFLVPRDDFSNCASLARRLAPAIAVLLDRAVGATGTLVCLNAPDANSAETNRHQAGLSAASYRTGNRAGDGAEL